MRTTLLAIAAALLLLALSAQTGQAGIRVRARYGQSITVIHGGTALRYSWYPSFRPRMADPFSDLPPAPPPYGSIFYVPGHGYREYSGDFYWDLRGLHGKLPSPDQPAPRQPRRPTHRDRLNANEPLRSQSRTIIIRPSDRSGGGRNRWSWSN